MTHDPDLLPTVQGIRSLFAAAACSCALVDDEGDALVFVAADGEGADQIIGLELPVGRGIAGWAVMSGQPIAIRDVRSDARFARDVAESTSYVPTSILAAPIFSRTGEVQGVIEVLDAGVDQGSGWTLDVLGTMASQVGAFLALRRTASGADADLAELGRRVLDAVETHSRGRS
jgi:signal transduction protein with GAF and PtsI domain